MNLGLVEKIANAVLYEGYILYPYRASAVKNQQRWNFGALYPRAFSVAQGGAVEGVDGCAMQTECPALANHGATIDVRVRFLHLVAREIGELLASSREPGEADLQEGRDYRPVAMLEVGGQLFQTWQEAVERDVEVLNIDLNKLAAGPLRQGFAFPATREISPLCDGGRIAGVIVRRQQAVEGSIEVSAERMPDQPGPLFKISVRILNETELAGDDPRNRDDALMRSLVSTHTILSIRDGEFVSLLEPPEALAGIAASCRNAGTWPVMVGEAGERDCMLSSPIILYDYPQIAPESAGDLFDSTEIDEILTLRILTLTDEEKREMRGVDERARRILERTETLPLEQLMKLHATMRSPRPTGEEER